VNQPTLWERAVYAWGTWTPDLSLAVAVGGVFAVGLPVVVRRRTS